MANFSLTWIAVVGGRKAYIFELGSKKNLSLVKEIIADLDEVHEKPGRTHDSMGSGRHAIEPHTDRREVEKKDFAAKILENLSQDSKQNQFERLILISDPKMLGLINNNLDKNLIAKVQKSFSKNLAEMEISEIEKAVLEMV